MGCGKSFLSRRLAEAMGISVIDMDKYIEEKYFMSVPDIFAKFGEEEFRQREKLVLKELTLIDDVIIATGGGAPCFFDNVQVMKNAGVLLYIKVSEEIIVERLMNSKHKRPLVDGKSKEELIDFVSAKIKEREDFYLQAHDIIDPTNQSLESIIELIEKLS